MVVFKCNEDVSMEEWFRWKEYITDCNEKDKPILLPDFIDLLKNIEEGEEIDFEEE